MPIDTRDIMELVCTLSEDHELKVTVTESLKGGIITGCGAMVGGLLAGPVGIAVGGAAAGCYAAYSAQGKFKPAVIVIRSMEEGKQRKLAQLVTNVVHNLDVRDAAALLSIVMGDPSIQKQIIGTVITFLREEMRMEIQD